MNKKVLFTLSITSLLFISLTACTPASSEPSSQAPTYDNYFKANKEEYKTTYNGLRTSSIYTCEAKQDGDVKVLVVPVDFIGYEAERMPLGAEGTIEALETAYFGDPENPDDAKNLYHHSLASFYKMSSYGKCNITGRVLPWWHTEKTPLNYLKQGGTPSLVSAVQEYYCFGEGRDIIDVRDYDGNNDGYIDLVHFVYTCPTGAAKLNEDDNSFWAYCTSTSSKNDNPSETALISRYIFASYEFLYEGGNVKNDGTKSAWTNTQKKNNEVKFSTHTLIHESGHGLGLPDYYSYDYNGDNPLGGLDMMDHNIGDHNAVSKGWLGWVEPYVVTGDADITIGAYETTGDCILVPINDGQDWKEDVNTLLEEYIMIQFDTGKGVAQTDASVAYNSNKYFSEPGVRILHADARIGLLASDGSFLGYSKSYKVNPGYYADLAHDNTASRTVNDNDLLEVILPSGVPNNKIVSNDSLWQAGETLNDFEMNTVLPTSSFNEKYNLGYTITIEEINGSDSALIKIRAINPVIE